MSGGADSTALLLALRNLAAEQRLALHAAHLHHGLRGPEADRDRAFVRALCRRLGIPLTSAAWDTRARMRRRGLSGEAGLRVLRHEFLVAAAVRARAPNIVTAHHADDQLETLLLRLGRGTGLTGLAGMRPARAARAGADRVRWLKPLLGLCRGDLEADLLRVGQPWCEDASNREPAFARNRVRHAAAPALARALFPGLGPAARRALLARRAAELAADALASQRALDAWAGRVLRREARIQAGGRGVPVSALAGLPTAVREAALRLLWRGAAGRTTGLTRAHLAGLGRLIDSARRGGMIHLPEGWTAVRAGGVLHLRIPAEQHEAARRGGPRPGRTRSGSQASHETSRKPHGPIRHGGHLPGGGRVPGVKPARDGDRRHPEGPAGPSGAR